MKISVDVSALRGTHWYQYALRFVLGGLVSLGAALIAKQWGPVLGGLFLAFPAIFPATATLISERERQKKARKGLNGSVRGQRAAALDAAGTVTGAFGLVCFACLVWRQLSAHPAIDVLSAASLAWLSVSVVLWWLRKKHWFLHGHTLC